MNLAKNKKGITWEINFLLSIGVIVILLTGFVMVSGKFFEPIEQSIREVPDSLDDTSLLITMLRTEFEGKPLSDLLINSQYETFEQQITPLISNHFGEDRFWELTIKDKTIGTAGLVFKGDKIYESSIILPLLSKEAVDVELSIYKK